MVSLSIHERFVEQAHRTPHAVAVSGGSRTGPTMTYAELDARANQLAHRLLDLGVGAESAVAVLLERSPHVVVAFLAALKTGGFYLPLHSAYPRERQQWIMDQCDRPVLLTDESMRAAGLPRGGAVVVLDADEEIAAQPAADPGITSHPDQLAYVMYTSGSTGQPKGVAIAHRDVLGLATDRCWDSGRHERVLMVAPYAFNVSTYEVWVPLLHGGQIVVAPPGDLEVHVLRRLLAEEQITGIHLTAGLFRVLAEEAPEALRTVREVLTGGDVIAPLAVVRVLAACPDTVVRAMYGATEATLFSTHSPMTAPYRPGASVPVGCPMDNVEAHVLDDMLAPVPPGAAGEVYIGGRGVARGYFGRTDLTAERFVADPFAANGQRMYRTGDLARRNPDGALEFIGRATDQVKVRGFRVEVAEVEAELSRHPGLAHVAVVARDTEAGDRQLIAYVVPHSAGVDVAAVRVEASQRLPEYMVPAAIVAVDRLPLTPNGKLDRRALPAPTVTAGSIYRPPGNDRQEVMCAVFADVLGAERVGIDDNFFELGGQSLSAMRVISRLRALLRVDLSITTFFDTPTVAALDQFLDGVTADSRPPGTQEGVS